MNSSREPRLSGQDGGKKKLSGSLRSQALRGGEEGLTKKLRGLIEGERGGIIMTSLEVHVKWERKVWGGQASEKEH